jgi:hypothetical protein
MASFQLKFSSSFSVPHCTNPPGVNRQASRVKGNCKAMDRGQSRRRQCNVTALLVHELFGGELLKTRLPDGDHFYNRIDGVRFDFTESQFAHPITYVDLPTTRDDAEFGATNAELAALRTAFLWHTGASD